METNNKVEQVSAGVNMLIDRLKQVPIPEELSTWSCIAQFNILNQAEESFVWSIQNGSSIFALGKSADANITYSGTKAKYIKALSKPSWASINLKLEATAEDASKFGLVWWNIAQEFKKDPDLVTKMIEQLKLEANIEKDEVVKPSVLDWIVTQQQNSKSILNEADGSWDWQEIVRSLKINYSKEIALDRNAIASSTLALITKKLLEQQFTSSVSTGGLTGNPYARSLEKMVDEHASTICGNYLSELRENGSIADFNVPHITYQTGTSFVSSNLTIAKLITIYAMAIAEIRKEELSRDITILAYQFFITDLQRYLREVMQIKFLENEELVDWMMIGQTNNERTLPFLLITSQRVLMVLGGRIVQEMRILDGEMKPVRIEQVEYTLFMQTNQRLLCYLPSILKAKFLEGKLAFFEPIQKAIYLKDSKLFLATSHKYLYVWPEEKAVEMIPQAEILRCEVISRDIEKKVLFMTQKSQGHMLVIEHPNRFESTIHQKDIKTVDNFLSNR